MCCAEERFKSENILLPVLSKANVYKKHGMNRVLNGVDSNGVQHKEANFGADMRELGEGVWCQIPDDERGGVRWVRLRAWVTIVTADFLAKMSLLPGMEGSRAHKFCSDCDYDTRSASADQPFSFYRSCSRSVATGGNPPKLNTWERMEATLKNIRAASENEQKQLLKEAGYNCAYFALDQAYGWAPDPSQCPQDLLHLFSDGLLRHEGAWMVKVLYSHGMELDSLNRAITGYKGFPPDVRIPPLHSKLTEGTDAGRPRRESMLKMTGSQVMHFCLHRCDPASLAGAPRGGSGRGWAARGRGPASGRSADCPLCVPQH